MIEPAAHTKCSSCGSSDAGQIYDDGHFHCHKCGYHLMDLNNPVGNSIKHTSNEGFLQGEYLPLAGRGISADTCRLFKYRHASFKGEDCTVADGIDPRTGNIVAQRIRLADKQFLWGGDSKAVGLFGQERFGKGKRIVITEGHEDAMAVSEIFNNSWPVVSVQHGCNAAKKDLIAQLDYLTNFDEIVLLFDMDDAGRKAAIECAEILPMGRTFLASISEKDACDMLKAGKGKELYQSIWNAKPYRLDGILTGKDLVEEVLKPTPAADTYYGYDALDGLTGGIRKGEIVLMTSGVGMGKSSLFRQIIHRMIKENKKVGVISLEEPIKTAGKKLIGLELNRKITSTGETSDAVADAARQLFEKNVVMYKNSGCCDSQSIINIVRQMTLCYNLDYVFIDHLSQINSSKDAKSSKVDMIDQLMVDLQNIVMEIGTMGLFAICQTKRVEGKGHEEGAEIFNSHFRGSRSLESVPDIIIVLQGDQRESSGNQNIRQLVVRKNRFDGSIGYADKLLYNKTTGHLTQLNEIANVGEF